MTAPFEVLTVGRCGIDIYPLQVGVGLEEVTSFGKFLGGSPTNVAIAAARLGRRSAVITRTGDDPFGVYVRRELERLGVDPRYVASVSDLPTPVTFCEVFPPDDFPIYFYRKPKAPDMQLEPDELDEDAIRDVDLLWVTVTGLSEEPSRAAHHRALEIRSGRRHTVLDLDYRSAFWQRREEATAQMGAVLSQVTVAVGNAEECEVAIGESEPRRAARALLDAGVQLAVVKLGPRGVLGMTEDEVVEVPPHAVQVLNGLGAGDSFGGSLCHGLLAGWPLEEVLRRANVAGAIVASRLECSTAMPSLDEIEAELLTTTDNPRSDATVARR